jgi:hypothetical protein
MPPTNSSLLNLVGAPRVAATLPIFLCAMLFTNLSFDGPICATLVNATFDLPAMRDAKSSMSGIVDASVMITKIHHCITSVRMQVGLVELGLVGLRAQDTGDGRQRREGFDVVVDVAVAVASVTAGLAPPGRRRRHGSLPLLGRRGGGIRR